MSFRATRAQQCKRLKQTIEPVCSWARSIAVLLQSTYSNEQGGAFENFQQLFKDMRIILRTGPKVFFQYELRFANRLQG
ncbi:hypothetical protein EAS62_12095 [Bradyrhizobium zhanjiangense]|uniref:Uncharacterized protein n=1 Tax=Bradyrhizobium zhanjiangense TaxID=1325107 RepID=A0ABY0DMS2_9BRAD|nr:hypothetical protein EAS62_12095 [Bradyrhizobium zhanjiangense]